MCAARSEGHIGRLLHSLRALQHPPHDSNQFVSVCWNKPILRANQASRELEELHS